MRRSGSAHPNAPYIKDNHEEECQMDEMDLRFAAIRQQAADRQLVILRPDRRSMTLPAMSRDDAPPSAVQAVEDMLPSSVQRNVAVIADTTWTMGEDLALVDANRAIPFFGMLMGFAAIGHAVWIADGSTTAGLVACARDGDILMVDSARIEALPEDWQCLVAPVMRGRQIVVHDRATWQLAEA
jgi:hypothetical protein